MKNVKRAYLFEVIGMDAYQSINAAFSGGNEGHRHSVSTCLVDVAEPLDIRFESTELMLRFSKADPKSQEGFVRRFLDFMKRHRFTDFEVEVMWGSGKKIMYVEMLPAEPPRQSHGPDPRERAILVFKLL